MKVQVNMEDEMVARIDEYARRMSVSRSSWCAMMIGQALMAMDKSMLTIEKLAENAQMSIDDFLAGMAGEELIPATTKATKSTKAKK